MGISVNCSWAEFCTKIDSMTQAMILLRARTCTDPRFDHSGFYLASESTSRSVCELQYHTYTAAKVFEC